MWGFSGGMILLGVVLGFAWRSSPASARYRRFFGPLLLTAVAIVVLAAILPGGWLKFALVVLQAPAVGATLIARAAQP